MHVQIKTLTITCTNFFQYVNVKLFLKKKLCAYLVLHSLKNLCQSCACTVWKWQNLLAWCFFFKKKKKRWQSISVISTLAVSGRWYRGCRQVGAQNPKWECATLTNTEGYWTSKRDCQPSQENPNCLHGLAKLDRSEDRAWILPWCLILRDSR